MEKLSIFLSNNKYYPIDETLLIRYAHRVRDRGCGNHVCGYHFHTCDEDDSLYSDAPIFLLLPEKKTHFLFIFHAPVFISAWLLFLPLERIEHVPQHLCCCGPREIALLIWNAVLIGFRKNEINNILLPVRKCIYSLYTWTTIALSFITCVCFSFRSYYKRTRWLARYIIAKQMYIHVYCVCLANVHPAVDKRRYACRYRVNLTDLRNYYIYYYIYIYFTV